MDMAAGKNSIIKVIIDFTPLLFLGFFMRIPHFHKIFNIYLLETGKKKLRI